MKIIKSTIIWTTLIFVTLTFITMQNESASDGFDTYGFPLTFYDHFEGKCTNCHSKFGFNPYYLILDILFATTLSFFVQILKRKFKQSSDIK